MSVSSILPAVVMGVAFVVAVRSLPVLHPIQIWAGSWAVATVLYALRLLPYRDLSWLTAGLICGGLVAFALGSRVGERLAVRRRIGTVARDRVEVVESAAWLSLGLLALTFVGFMAQLLSRFPVGQVVHVSLEVKTYLSSGEAPLSGTYVDVAIAATVLCALAGALAQNVRRRRQWLALAVVCTASIYFSTSRAFIAVALIAGAAVLVLLAKRITVNRRRLAAGVTAAVILVLAAFLALGTALGKTYGNSTIGQFDNFFSRHPTITWLALPYEDTTASIPALDLLVGVSPTWGTAQGCATAPIPCGVLRKLGFPTTRVPVTGAFTKAPLQWNGYTFLDRFLIDGGTALALVFVAATGVLAGYLWSVARAGSTVAATLYALVVPSLVLAYRQNLLETVALAAVVALGLLWVARPVSAFRASLREHRDSLPA